MTALGNNIRHWRELRGISQEQVSLALAREGVARNRATVSQYETGDRTPTVEVIHALCRVLRCKTEDLMGSNTESLVDLPSDPATKADIERILREITDLRMTLAQGIMQWVERELVKDIERPRLGQKENAKT